MNAQHARGATGEGSQHLGPEADVRAIGIRRSVLGADQRIIPTSGRAFSRRSTANTGESMRKGAGAYRLHDGVMKLTWACRAESLWFVPKRGARPP